jgi:hypothetical protein
VAENRFTVASKTSKPKEDPKASRIIPKEAILSTEDTESPTASSKRNCACPDESKNQIRKGD